MLYISEFLLRISGFFRAFQKSLILSVVLTKSEFWPDLLQSVLKS